MFDEIESLAEVPGLGDVLAHYAGKAAPDRQAWQDRVMEMNELTPAQLTRLHGELMAYGWLELNAGATPAATPGNAPGCYRVTPAGLRALREHHSGTEAA